MVKVMMLCMMVISNTAGSPAKGHVPKPFSTKDAFVRIVEPPEGAKIVITVNDSMWFFHWIAGGQIDSFLLKTGYYDWDGWHEVVLASLPDSVDTICASLPFSALEHRHPTIWIEAYDSSGNLVAVDVKTWDVALIDPSFYRMWTDSILNVTDIPDDQGREVRVSFWANNGRRWWDWDKVINSINFYRMTFYDSIPYHDDMGEYIVQNGDFVGSMPYPSWIWTDSLLVSMVLPTLGDSTEDGIVYSAYAVAVTLKDNLYCIGLGCDALWNLTWPCWGVGYSIDNIPPYPVNDLYVYSNDGGVVVRWTVPDEGTEYGRAVGYELRYSTEPPGDDTLAWWENATPVENLPPVGEPWSMDSVVVTGLQPGFTYYFALRLYDSTPNYSPLSNIASYEFTGQSEGDDVIAGPMIHVGSVVNGELSFKLALPKASEVKLSVIDISGRTLAKIYEGMIEPGEHEFRYVPERSGIYFIKADLEDGKTVIKKVVYTR